VFLVFFSFCAASLAVCSLAHCLQTGERSMSGLRPQRASVRLAPR
jgi:hypothetical protein